MANGSKVDLIGLAIRLGPRAGAFCGGCYSVAYLLYFIEDPSLGNAAQMIFGVGFAVGAYSIGKSVQGLGQLYVANEAEKRADPSSSLPEATRIPAIRREMEKQAVGSSQVATLPRKE